MSPGTVTIRVCNAMAFREGTYCISGELSPLFCLLFPMYFSSLLILSAFILLSLTPQPPTDLHSSAITLCHHIGSEQFVDDAKSKVTSTLWTLVGKILNYMLHRVSVLEQSYGMLVPLNLVTFT
ncbi:hypothetical protein AMECASPLE_029889 [Ameca splendens]|uniref:Uncharacterized protein n=1 Tax=Ameca splendens TaxID=208324 RepID=A0ABV0Y5R9_9TELE